MKVLKWIDEKLELSIFVILMTLMTIIIFVQVIMRYVMKNSLVWSEELARYLFIWLIYLGISYGAKCMKHIKIEDALGLFPIAFRPKVVLIGDFVFFMFSVFISYTAFTIVLKQLKLGQESPAMNMPIWIIYAAPMVGFGLTAIRLIQTILYRVKQNDTHRGEEING